MALSVLIVPDGSQYKVHILEEFLHAGDIIDGLTYYS